MEPHRHAWAYVDVGLDEGRPVVRQRCGCGAARSMPAWDRSWNPPESLHATATMDPERPAGALLRNREQQRKS
jgi:hypothetical protein